MSPDQPTAVILCADDFAIAPGVSRAIIELIRSGRLSATSCMSISPFWPEHAEWLKPLAGKADIGLHLTLTQLKPLAPMPLTALGGRLPSFGQLARAAYLGRLVLTEIEAELERQFEAFERAFGAQPKFIDGHHHVHQLPGVGGLVVDLFRKRLLGSGSYLRVCSDELGAVLRRGGALRALVIGLAGRPLRAAAHKAGIPTNTGFAGFYDFTDRIPYAKLFPRFLGGVTDRLLIMCHPGWVDDELRQVDTLTDQREREYAYYQGDDFLQVMSSAGLKPSRFWD